MNLPNGGDRQVINDQNNAPQHHNHYDLSYCFAAGERFGEISPVCFAFGVPDDKNFTTRVVQKLKTTSLSSPLLQDLKKNLDYYAVPMKAILPRNWDKLNSNPVIGEDVDASLVNCVINLHDGNDGGVIDPLRTLVRNFGLIQGTLNLQSYSVAEFYGFMKLLATYEVLFAPDSLFAAYRMPLNKRYPVIAADWIATGLNQAWTFFHDFLNTTATHHSGALLSVNYKDASGQVIMTRRYKLTDLSERMRFFYDYLENPSIQFLSVSDSQFTTDYNSVMQTFSPSMLDRASNEGVLNVLYSPNDEKPFDISPILAYQLVCAEYFTNDHIDFIYSAELYRQLYEGFIEYWSISNYTLNGFNFSYDGFSHVVIAGLFASISSLPVNDYCFSLFLNLFTRKRSLRFVDYFTGARSHPLAVGDVNIQVNAQNEVSAIDVTKGIQSARYLLAVNRVGAKAKNYLKGIFGATMRTRTDVPVKIGHMDEVIYGVETQNTGSDQLSKQQSITTNLESRSSDFAFQMDLSEDSILIGVSSYDITRMYTEGWSKFANKIDRFDRFNPYFQYTGDQPIYQSELLAGLDDSAIFGYQSKDTEYKLQTDYAIGPFLDELRGWIFTQNDIRDNVEISPDFIRAHQTELDRYFIDFTAIQSWQRYHFICFYDIKMEASRNMVFDPQILK